MENIAIKESRIKSKTTIDKIVKAFFMAIAILSSSIIIFIIGFILVKGIEPFFKDYPVGDEMLNISFSEFLFGLKWGFSPNHFGAGFIVINTIYITLLALVIALPLSIFSSLFIARIAPKRLGNILLLIIELLASIPSIVYGLFGQAYLTKGVIKFASMFGIQTLGGQTILTTALVLAIMIFPTITMVSTNAIRAVKNDIIWGSIALGASKTETNFKVVLKASKNGIFAGVILGIGRALGEATAVSKVCGNATVGPSFSLFDTTSTLTTTILSGFSEASGMAYDIKFSLGLVLIIIIIITNLILNKFKRKAEN